MDRKILCFGDSITWGARDSRGGWVARVREKVDEECMQPGSDKFILTYNLGVSSDTSASVLERLQRETEARLKEGGEACFVFSIGTNDSIWLINENKFWVEIDKFKSNLQAIINIAKKFSSKIVFLGNYPVDEDKTLPTYTSDETIRSHNEDIERYEQAAQEITSVNDIHFINVYNLFTPDAAKQYLFNDGVHPNDAGHEKLAELVYGFMKVEGWL
jgi:lysophospholipase L1-like esterase